MYHQCTVCNHQLRRIHWTLTTFDAVLLKPWHTFPHLNGSSLILFHAQMHYETLNWKSIEYHDATSYMQPLFKGLCSELTNTHTYASCCFRNFIWFQSCQQRVQTYKIVWILVLPKYPCVTIFISFGFAPSSSNSNAKH